jgi:amino acid adenylation domain-containing protein
VHKYLEKYANESPEKIAVICGEQRFSYREIDALSERLAHTLKENGLEKQSRVIIFLDNSIETVISIYGVLKAGCVFVVLNGAIKASKLAYILKDSGASAVITHVKKRAEVNKALASLEGELPILWVGMNREANRAPRSIFWQEALRERISTDIEGPGNVEEIERVIDQDLATLIYTSGSTGEPKGVMSSHHNMISAARSIIQYLGNTPDDIIMAVLPLSFDYGLYQVIMAFMFGGTVVIEQSFMFPLKILETIEREKVTGFPIVPTVAAFLLKMGSLEKFDFSSLRYMTNTGAALPIEHIKKLRVLFPDVKIYSMFGLTECKRVCYLPPEEIDRIPGSVGKAMPNCEVLLLDEEGNEVGPGDIGEMVVRGSNVMRGYWNSPELTARTFRDNPITGEKLLYSGDYFRKDKEEILYFLGRKDDMIKTKGERVSPKEVENAVCEVDGVLETAVIGVEDELLGQAVKAFVILEEGASVQEKDILSYCRNNLEIWMIPKYIKFVDNLPRTPNGKVDKNVLK